MTAKAVRLAAVILTAAGLSLVSSLPSEADTAPVGQEPKPTGEIVGNTPSIAIAYDSNGRTVAQRTYRSSSGGPRWDCYYYATRAVPGSLELGVDTTVKITPELDQSVALTCFEDGKPIHQEIFLFDPAMPFGSLNVGVDAALLARELLPLPDPDVITSPPAGRPQLVGVATWFRVDTDWQPVSATATLGGVSATVTATPTGVEWDPGDGSPTITCDGPGTAFDPAHPDATSTCSHTYLRRTPGDSTLALTATITYAVTWTATDGAADTLDPVTRTSIVAITVDEAQALIR